jgi:hypothetical protein
MSKDNISEEGRVSKTERFLYWLLLIIILFDLYCVSFFVALKPCNNLGRFPYDVETFSSPKNGQPVFPETTWLCVIDNKYNVIAYYVYWPLHRILENRGYWHFIKNPPVLRKNTSDSQIN